MICKKEIDYFLEPACTFIFPALRMMMIQGNSMLFQIPMTLIFTKCDKRKKKRHGGKKAEENVQDFQELISGFFETVPPWIMTSSLTNQGRDEMLLHMAQLRNYWLKH